MPALLALVPAVVWRWLAIAGVSVAAAGAAWLNGHGHGEATVQARWDAEHAAQVAAAAKVAAAQAVKSANVEVKYVQVIQYVDRPVPEIRDRLVLSACPVTTVGLQPDTAGTGGVPVPGEHPAVAADAAAPANADAGLIDRLAADLPDAERNAIQLEQLQALVRANTAEDKP